ncbi:DUF5677 domain-containing protein [Paenibacillus riograndensis]|uniref:Uncharacterized protein n=1 Tax=Paenibacillus riograndensis SBR5 TaxID=1073571 RepID=A0A0E4CXN1_9BACL|nr:DUF5677 domain-containing protein [Paenibacillus riograndensis]CQR56539.1 hypothetical protein PRIO_4137 [Paenibacillus riograndensis SBR5]
MKRLAEIARQVSRIENKKHTVTSRILYAEDLFEKALLNVYSFIRLWPHDAETKKTFDASSLASLARNIIETHKVYHYISELDISKEEFELRWSIMVLHDGLGRERILNKLGFSEEDSVRESSMMSVSFAEGVLRKNSLFNLLDEKLKKKIMKGEKPYLFERIAKNHSPINKDHESGMYNFLSNSVHSFPLGIINYKGGFSENFHLGMYHLVTIAVEVSIMYFASIVDSYTRLRRFVHLLNKEDIKFIKTMLKSGNFYEWLDQRISKGMDFVYPISGN